MLLDGRVEWRYYRVRGNAIGVVHQDDFMVRERAGAVVELGEVVRQQRHVFPLVNDRYD